MSCTENKRTTRRRRHKKITRNVPLKSNVSINTGLKTKQIQVERESRILEEAQTNTFLKGEQCILCHCRRPPAELSTNQTDDHKSADLKVTARLSGDEEDAENENIIQVPLWVCPDCRKTVEEEEHRIEAQSALELDASSVGLPPKINGTEDKGASCTCDSCKERRELESQHRQDTEELQQKWLELRYEVSNIYKMHAPVSHCCVVDSNDEDDEIHSDPELECIVDQEKVKELVNQLCASDPHQLFQRLESQCREFVLDMKKRLQVQLKSGHSTPDQAQLVISMLLDNYKKVKASSAMLGPLLRELETKHLSQFHLTWDIHTTHLYQSIVYSDIYVQKSLPTLINLLRFVKVGNSTVPIHDDKYANLLHNYLKYDGEMSVVLVIWRECQQLLLKYNEKQETIKTKQKMLKEDWEFFRSQRKLLQRQIANEKGPSSHSFEHQFTETMLQRDKSSNKTDLCRCPDCKCNRCNCDECAISHYITCGIINPEVGNEFYANSHCKAGTHNGLYPPKSSSGPEYSGCAPPPWTERNGQYILDVHPPSMSSTSSSNDASSLVPFEHEIPTFEECNENFEVDGIDSDFDEEDSGNEDDLFNLCEQSNGDMNQFVIPPYTDVNTSTSNTPSCAPFVVDDNHDDGKKFESIDMENVNGVCKCEKCVHSNHQQPRIECDVKNKCQCYWCLSPKPNGVLSSSLPPQPTSSNHNPSSLNLYPHIHGQPPPLLPKLYELHNSGHLDIQGNSFGGGTSLANKQDLESKGLYHYSDWDNSSSSPSGLLSHSQNYDFMGTNNLSSLLTSNPFVTDPIPDITSEDTASFFRVGEMPSCIAMSNTNIEHVHTDACFKNKTSFYQQLADASLSSSMPHLAPGISKSVLQSHKNHSSVSASHTLTTTQLSTHHPNHRPRHSVNNFSNNINATNGNHPFKTTCTKDNNFMHENHYLHNRNCNTAATQSSTLQATSKNAFQSNTNSSTQQQQQAQQRTGNTRNHQPHSCSRDQQHSAQHPHDHQGVESCSQGEQEESWPIVNSGGCCASKENSCEKHHHHHHQKHDDESDSIDDSNSELSSNTSSSNQKDSKYCDCCYCEFFGHSGPPVQPVSRNYMEARDRLRLVRKKRSEKQEVKPESQSQKSQKAQGEKSLEELLQYINGDSPEKKAAKGKKKQEKAGKTDSSKREKIKNSREDQERIEIAKRKAEVNARIHQEELKDRQAKMKKTQIGERHILKANKKFSNLEKEAAKQISKGHESVINILRKRTEQLKLSDTPDTRQTSSDKMNKSREESSGVKQPSTPHKQNTTPQKNKGRQNHAPEEKKATKQQSKANKKKESTVQHESNNTTVAQPEEKTAHEKNNTNLTNGPHSKSPAKNVENGHLTTPNKSTRKNASKKKAKSKAESSPAPNTTPTVKQERIRRCSERTQEEIDKIFMPMNENDIEDFEEYDEEIEEFKRFCMSSNLEPNREKVNVNLKDIFNKRM